MDTVTLAANGFTFTARSAGPAAGRTVLLLHGFPQSSWSWRHQLAALAEAGYRAVAPDLRGYSAGARPDGAEHYDRNALVGDVAGFVDALGVDQVDLVGHDWGGALAWFVAGLRPELVRTLTVVSTPHPAAFGDAVRSSTGDQVARSGYMQFFRQTDGAPEAFFLGNDAMGLRGLFSGPGFEPGDADEYVRVLSEPGAMTAALHWYRANEITDPTGLGPITMPTMYVWSTDDMALGREAAEATGTYVSGPYRFEVLAGVSHWIAEEAADELSRLLLDHIGSSR